MTEPESATRAPESDLYEESLDDKQPLTYKPPSAPVEVPQTQTSHGQVSEHCTTDRPLPPSLSDPPSGTMSKWTIGSPGHEVEVYVSKPTDYPTTSARLLLLLTNGTGIHSPNNQHQADLFARQGYLVIMPDMFAGDPAPNSKPSETALESSASWLDTVKLKVAETAKSFGLDMWLARHTPEKVLPILQGVLQQAREEFADAVRHGDGIYAVGYCFGGKYVLILAGEKPESVMQGHEAQDKAEQGQAKREPEIKAGVCAHGTLVGREDIIGMKSPVQLICVEDDPLFPAEVLEDGRKWLTENKVEHQIEVYKGVPHGFAVVGEYESQATGDAQAKAFNTMVSWLDAH